MMTPHKWYGSNDKDNDNGGGGEDGGGDEGCNGGDAGTRKMVEVKRQ